jgi:hypothetical protein
MIFVPSKRKRKRLAKELKQLERNIKLHRGWQEEQIVMFENGHLSTERFNKLMLDDDVAIDEITKQIEAIESEICKL